MTKEREIHKDSKIGGANKWNNIVGDKSKLYTSRGSKLINLYVPFECAFHIFACMEQVLNFNIHACVVYASCRFKWWNKKLACIDYLVISFPSSIKLTMVLRMVYWCTPISITLQRSIFYTLASFGRHCLLYFLFKHMCKL